MSSTISLYPRILCLKMARHAMVNRGIERHGRVRSRALARPIALSVGHVAFLAAVAVVTTLTVVYVRQGTMIRDLTAQQASAEARLTEIEEINRQLVFEIEQAFSLSRLSRIARDRLGMEEPETVHYVPLSETQLP